MKRTLKTPLVIVICGGIIMGMALEQNVRLAVKPRVLKLRS